MKSPLLIRINKGLVTDLIASFLIATKQVPYDCEISSIEVNSDPKSPATKYQLKVHIQPEEVQVIYFDDTQLRQRE